MPLSRYWYMPKTFKVLSLKYPQMAKERYEYITKCEFCNGTGVNHYDDNNPCGVCGGSGMMQINNNGMYNEDVEL